MDRASRDRRNRYILFAHGRRYRQAIQDFYRLTGPVPLLPRFVFGNWWSRYHKYNDAEYRSLVRRFQNEKIPFTVAVLDMDWHLVAEVDPKYGTGWTGYTWNSSLFPNHVNFLAWLHAQGLKTTLNVHPRDGIRAFEKPYTKIAKAMNVDIDNEEPVEFDITNSKFITHYLEMHHDLEKEGVDFWWLDWQQGGITHMKDLDPLWMLNYLHFHDSGRDGRWPLTFSRYSGPGSHRYPIGFSGDTVVSWDSLHFQPRFTATASNIGYSWWSHDIGGHMFGKRDEELEARWYQLGVFSPINRLHSTSSPFNGKEPWNFHEPTRTIMIRALRLRQAFVPYLYTMNWRTALTGMPLVEPMYWAYPNLDNAYRVPNQFYFGTELIISPITTPLDQQSLRARTDIWLPQGEWYDFFTGRRYTSDSKNGRLIDVWRTVEDIPVFAKAGAIVPMQTDDERNEIANPSNMTILVFAGASNHFTLQEDDGIYPGLTETGLPVTDHMAKTIIDLIWDTDNSTTLSIQPASGNVSAVPKQRVWTIRIRGVNPSTAFVNGIKTETDYDKDTLTLTVTAQGPTQKSLTITFPDKLVTADDPWKEDCRKLLHDAQIDYVSKDEAWEIVKETGKRAVTSFTPITRPADNDALPWLAESQPSELPVSVTQALTEILYRN